MFKWFSKRGTHKRNAHNLYGSIVTITRSPALYNGMRIPDTLEMRFELLMFHMFVFLRWLNRSGEQTGKLRQALVNCFFSDIEITSRQVGVGDLSVPKKMRQLAALYAERMEAYQAASRDNTNGEMRNLLRATFFSGNRQAGKDARKFALYLERLGGRLDELLVEDVTDDPEVLQGLVEAAQK